LNDVPAVAKGAGRNETAQASRKPGFAAQPDVFVGFQLRHPQQTAEHLEPMALRQPGQIGDGFRDKPRGLIGPAIAARLIGAPGPIFASGYARPPVAFFLGQKQYPTWCLLEKYTPFRLQLWGAFCNFFDAAA
jgi:hypothetical protein